MSAEACAQDPRPSRIDRLLSRFNSIKDRLRLSPTVKTRLTYIGPTTERPRYYAVNSSRNVITRDRRTTPVRRFAHYNVWRALSPPPQDIPLALCDARSVFSSELVDADSIIDLPGKPESSLVVVLVRYSPHHRWSYFPDMRRNEVLVFKSHDSDPSQPHHVPHSAFKDPSCPTEVAPRVSIEARAVAFWFGS